MDEPTSATYRSLIHYGIGSSSFYDSIPEAYSTRGFQKILAKTEWANNEQSFDETNVFFDFSQNKSY
jgi:hypothetical protein